MSKEFKSFFKKVEGNEGERCHYPTRLDTYGCGCAHNCSYCYARSLLNFRGLWNPSDPSVANIEKIRKVIKTKLRKGDVVRLGGMSDCFQPIEARERVTLRTIEALNEAGVSYLIVTKSDLVARSAYLMAMDKRLAHIQVSVTSTSEELSKRVEGGAPPPSSRIFAIERLQELGFDVTVRLSPFIPQFVDVGIINSIHCDKILVEFLRVNTWIRKWLTSVDPFIDLSPYCLKRGGYDHLTLDAKRALLASIRGFKEVSVCEDVEEHQDYWRAKVNANPNDCCNLERRDWGCEDCAYWKEYRIGSKSVDVGVCDNPNSPWFGKDRDCDSSCRGFEAQC